MIYILTTLTLFFVALLMLSISNNKYFLNGDYKNVAIIALVILGIFGWLLIGLLATESKYDKVKDYKYKSKDFIMYRLLDKIIIEHKDLSKETIIVNDDISKLDSSQMKFKMIYHYDMYKILMDSSIIIEKK